MMGISSSSSTICTCLPLVLLGYEAGPVGCSRNELSSYCFCSCAIVSSSISCDFVSPLLSSYLGFGSTVSSASYFSRCSCSFCSISCYMRFFSSLIFTSDSLSLCTVFCRSSDCSSEELSDATLLHLLVLLCSFLSSAVYDLEWRSF